MKRKPKSNISKVTGKPKLKKGFACMSQAERSRIAAMGGKKVSRNRRHMKRIGAIGGSRGKGGLRKAA